MDENHKEILHRHFTVLTFANDFTYFFMLLIQIKGITSIYFDDWTEYYSIESVNVTHSGEYICTSKNNQRNTYVRVLGK